MAAQPPPKMPPIKCVELDCPGNLRLREMPRKWKGKSPWAYSCDQPGCSGVLAAHPNGEPAGVPATKEIRVARKECHRVFDRLWNSPRELNPRISDEVAAKLRPKLRDRAYAFMAEKLGVPTNDVHMGAMTDLVFMREFYQVAKKSSMKEIDEWWTSRQRQEPKQVEPGR